MMGEFADMAEDMMDAEEYDLVMDDANVPGFAHCRHCKKLLRWVRVTDTKWRLFDGTEMHHCIDPKIIEEFPIVEGV